MANCGICFAACSSVSAFGGSLCLVCDSNANCQKCTTGYFLSGSPNQICLRQYLLNTNLHL